MKKLITTGSICLMCMLYGVIAYSGTSIKINSASVDISTEELFLNGINFNAFGPVSVTIGNTLLDECTISDNTIKCSLTGTPVLSGEASWAVSISAGNSPHTNDDINVFIQPEQVNSSCPVGSLVECYSGESATRNIGLCQSGTITCLSDGTWGECEGEILPGFEFCDGADNDCDGLIDNSCQQCSPEEYAIIEGCFVECASQPTCLENCLISNTFSNQCIFLLASIENCLSLSPVDCLFEEYPLVCVYQECTAEWQIAFGDIIPHECSTGETRACGVTDIGPCSYGTQACVDGFWGACVGNVNPSPEICTNGIDEDCDGITDNCEQ